MLNKRIITIQLTGLLLLSFFSCTQAQNSDYKYSVPKKLSDGWEVSSLEAEGIEPGPILEISAQIRDIDLMDNVLSMLIVKNGKLVHEVYSPYCQRNTLHWMASITKSVSSTLIGIAIDKGFIKSVNESVVDLLPEYKNALKDPKFRNISLKHIMTMTSGIEWNEQVSYNNPRNSEYQMVETDDWMRFVLSHDVNNTPGTGFLYNTGSIHLLSAVIKSVTGLYANQFAEEHLFHPMGIYGYQWNRDPRGYPCTGGTDGGVGLRSRDLAKFGWLFLYDGTWQGQRIISQKWIAEATKKYPLLPGRRSYYSYNWFPGTKTVNGISFDYKATFGYGGQILFIVPEYELILIFTCELAEGGYNSNILADKVLSAIIKSN
ncbi:serine hydrolase domain-containing protein [Bacteroidota bacterium]